MHLMKGARKNITYNSVLEESHFGNEFGKKGLNSIL